MRQRPSVDVLGILPNDLLKVLLSNLDGTYAIPYVLVGHISVFKAPNKGHEFLFHSIPLEKNPGGIGDGREVSLIIMSQRGLVTETSENVPSVPEFHPSIFLLARICV